MLTAVVGVGVGVVLYSYAHIPSLPLLLKIDF